MTILETLLAREKIKRTAERTAERELQRAQRALLQSAAVLVREEAETLGRLYLRDEEGREISLREWPITISNLDGTIIQPLADGYLKIAAQAGALVVRRHFSTTGRAEILYGGADPAAAVTAFFEEFVKHVVFKED